MLNGSSAASSSTNASGKGVQVSRRRWTVLQWIEWTLLLAGLSLIAGYGAARLESWFGSRALLNSMQRIDASQIQPTSDRAHDVGSSEVGAVKSTEDTTYANKESVLHQSVASLGVLQIPKIHLAVPLLDGTDDLTLNHAVGRIRGTARPGEQGNIGIAGHRDGFFRGLKEVRLGDAIDLRTDHETATYVVDEIHIVTPDNVSVLNPRPVDSLTLVTCYPFHFIGKAPQRYIVMASLINKENSGSESSMAGPKPLTSNTTKEEK
jgi:sortase A